ncbi:hypothetical protein DSO57_1006119, partial [Entomophthora muscae]
TQQQSTNAPVVRCGRGCPHGSKNRVSATQVPTQREDRGEFNSDTTLKQPVQRAQAARVWSINPWVPKLIWKPTKVTTSKTVRNKEVYVINEISILVLKTWKLKSGSQGKPYVDQSRQKTAQLPVGSNPGLPEIVDPNQEEWKPANLPTCQVSILKVQY